MSGSIKGHSDQLGLDPRILPIGELMRIDDDGYFVDGRPAQPISPPWDEVVDEFVRGYQDQLGERLHSLYIRGSLIRGTAIEGVSDLDAILLVNGDATTIDWSWRKALHLSLCKKYPFVNGLDVGVNNLDRILSGQNKVRAFLIKIMSQCVAGEDVRDQLPRVKLGQDALIARWDFTERTQPNYFMDKDVDLSEKTSLIGKQIVRAGMELVMEEERAYSRDLFVCYEMFAKHFPHKTSAMARALTQALFSAESEADFAEMRDDISPWLADELDKKYPVL